MAAQRITNWTLAFGAADDVPHLTGGKSMAMISLRQLLDHAAEHHYGVPAFNINNMEQVQAIMQAADETDSPVILQASAGARKYAGEAFLRHITEAAVEPDGSYVIGEFKPDNGKPLPISVKLEKTEPAPSTTPDKGVGANEQ